MRNFSLIIKTLRVENNLMQKDIAQNLNVPKNTYGAWERGDNEPPIDIIRKLADFYNVSTDYLFDREEEDGRIIIQELELPSDENNLLTNYRKLPSDLKESAQEYLKSLNNINNKHNIK